MGSWLLVFGLDERNTNGLIAAVGACLVAFLLVRLLFSWDGTPVRNREDWGDGRSPDVGRSGNRGSAGFGGVGGDGVPRRSD